MERPYSVAGVDEVGRGPLAGPVVAAAVILDPAQPIKGLLDSKVLSESRREELDAQIRDKALDFCVAQASVQEIDALNILHASMLAMQRAVHGLAARAELVLVDGNRCPTLSQTCRAIVKGDAKVQSISAASIIAKVYRDRMMVELHSLYPEFGFDRHKGYPTAEHRHAISVHGILHEHRRSFAPVKAATQLYEHE